jgi:hypothetical protein
MTQQTDMLKAQVGAVMDGESRILLKTVGFLAGRCPRPSLGDGMYTRSSPRPGRQSPYPGNLRDGKGSLRSARGQTLAVAENLE